MSDTSSMLREQDIDNDKLISEIKSRPPLYDKTFKEYSDVSLKTQLWKEVTVNVFMRHWDNLNQAEKMEAGTMIQRRWKNIRTCFSRELRQQKAYETRKVGKRRRKYIYSEKLLFLKPYMEMRETVASSIVTNIEKPLEQQSSKPSEKIIISKPSTSRQAFEYNQRRSHREIKQNENPFNIDQEKHFALSLVPMLKSLDVAKKLEVQIKILEIFKNVNRSSNMNPLATHRSNDYKKSYPSISDSEDASFCYPEVEQVQTMVPSSSSMYLTEPKHSPTSSGNSSPQIMNTRNYASSPQESVNSYFSQDSTDCKEDIYNIIDPPD